MTGKRWCVGMMVRCGLAVAVIGLGVSGCAFKLDDKPPGAPNSCRADSDCQRWEACNPLSNICVLQPPPAESMVVTGPFECLSGAQQWGGAALAAEWPSFQSNGRTIPGGAASISHGCEAGYIPDQGVYMAFMRGPRHYEPLFDTLGFYELQVLVRMGQAAPGQTVSPPDSGAFLMFCPASATPEDGSIDETNPWQSAGAYNKCLQLFESGGGAVYFESTGVENGGTVRGFLRFDLMPSLVLPEP